MKTQSLILATLLLGAWDAVNGATTIYTNRAAFDAAAASFGALTTDSYEAYPNDLIEGSRTITLSNFNVAYNLAASGYVFGVTDVPDPTPGSSGLGPTDGTKYLYADYAAGRSDVAVTFLFSGPLHAFGTDIIDLETGNMSYTTSSGSNGTAGFAGSDGNVQFFGIVSDTEFTSIALSHDAATLGDGVGFDQTTIAAPEPSSFSLILPGLAGLACRRRKPQERSLAE